jgi:5-methyltetrahydropteroyltriglutamate--homocysteine methyltransferase
MWCGTGGCGIDIIDGGSSQSGFIAYIDGRLAGVDHATTTAAIDSREKQAFPEFYAHGHSGTRPPPMFCTGPVLYTGQRQLQTDIENLKAALKDVRVTDVFMPAVSPGQIHRYHVNRYYKSDDEFLIAIGEAMREEYKAIIEAGFIVQIDDPHLAMLTCSSPIAGVADVGAGRTIRGNPQSPCATCHGPAQHHTCRHQ